ncbi:MAG TPA: class I SAM-dependent methyltransferase [Streptosporangiaceae bacterium]|nr:class I SAM-dependent methyltransferase [Streptosporangiaceae bacterium]
MSSWLRQCRPWIRAGSACASPSTPPPIPTSGPARSTRSSSTRTWSAWPGSGRARNCWRWAARPARRRCRWPGAGCGSTGLELGAELAAAARANLAEFAGVQVINADFETWQPPAGQRYDLVYAATAWHWIDPALGYRRACELLRPGGHLALWGQLHVFPDGGDPIFGELQDTYDEIGEGQDGELYYRPGETPDASAEIEASGLFGDVAVRRYDWEVRYDADGYLALLDTFSGHIAMAGWQRDRLYGEIRRRLALRPDGMLRRHWESVLHVARRLDEPGR